ncbi:2-nitropropane dioxygenase [Marinitoga sp. 1135]|uniref:2-nitropropane dioxygenase-like enzyme n=1 Tax=Marinitoga piezophila (strain DSM 14283 / JCM 11233 / KA3) TaxID=443254 RepID=H2J2R2_MARPK|nr:MULTISPECIES: nitronate monooxygenase [Marinitoga]AEX84506.1 2-nitropropane dioxygenase-like enzyme [Marinitoga piezophila KA3]APT75000.1 2-nitropropane dioxygenase [Marinitoga sp. 1137]NUU94755.1 2-nitropropane dioxygenase [Marinitoga sp. 1135]NUU96684.1 2-nitropropane dioxygenase [Marinitoga sp. 1138]
MNRVTEILNIKYPIFEGGMAWVGTPKLAAAVSNAGGLGTIGAGSMTPEILEKAIDEINTLTDKTYAVNIILVNPYADQLVEIAIKKKVPVLVFGAGNPGKYIPELKENNIKVMAVVSSENLALRLQKAGVDIIIGEGMECGGHIGDVTTMVLIPKLVEVLDIPVVAAGGIADIRGMKAVIELGAEGIQMGTRFVATHECEAHENYKNLILKAGIRDAIVTGATMGHPARVLKTKFAKKIKKLEVASPEEAEELMVGSLRKAFVDGDLENGSFMAGQSAGLINEIRSVKEIVEEFGMEFEKILKERGAEK